MHGLFQTGARFVPNKARKSFSLHPIELLGDEAQVESRFGLLDIVLVLVQIGARFMPNVP